MSHSDYSGSEHRGQVITSMHGLPVTFTEAQDSVFRPMDDKERAHVGPLVDATPYNKHKPGAVHRVYAAGKVLADVPARQPHPVIGYRCIREANRIAARARRAGMTDVTVDAWLSEAYATNAYDTAPDDRQTESIYREAMNDQFAWMNEMHASGHPSFPTPISAG